MVLAMPIGSGRSNKLKRTLIIAAMILAALVVQGCGGGGGTGNGGPGGGGIDAYANKWLRLTIEDLTHPENQEHNFTLIFKTGDWSGDQLRFGIPNTSARSSADGQVIQPESFHGKIVYVSDDLNDQYSFEINFIDIPGSGTHGMVGLVVYAKNGDGLPHKPNEWPVVTELIGIEYYSGEAEEVATFKATLEETEAPW